MIADVNGAPVAMAVAVYVIERAIDEVISKQSSSSDDSIISRLATFFGQKLHPLNEEAAFSKVITTIVSMTHGRGRWPQRHTVHSLSASARLPQPDVFDANAWLADVYDDGKCDRRGVPTKRKEMIKVQRLRPKFCCLGYRKGRPCTLSKEAHGQRFGRGVASSIIWSALALHEKQRHGAILPPCHAMWSRRRRRRFFMLS